ncbi:MAG: LytTR family DNA-binding domain-containing protein [Pseudomonadota bacterium]
MLTPASKLDWRWVRNSAAATFLFSLFLGFIGPLGDYGTVPVAIRITAWIAIGMLGFAVYAVTLLALNRAVRTWPWPALLALALVVGTAPLTPLVSVLDQVITGDEPPGLFAAYFTVLPIGAVYLALFEIVRVAQRRERRPTAAADVADADASATPTQRFMRRLPASLNGELVCLAKEDHYLRIYTTDGDCLIRFRMADAVAELETAPGLLTHRSWWVADAAVVSAKRKPTGGGEATLSNGLTAPIARARVADAQAAGWFQR